jgi:hypothetical protein
MVAKSMVRAGTGRVVLAASAYMVGGRSGPADTVGLQLAGTFYSWLSVGCSVGGFC